MTTVEILKLATKVAGSKDGGLSVITEILNQKNIKSMVLFIDKDGKGNIKNFDHNIIDTVVEQNNLINELVDQLSIDKTIVG